MEKIVLYHPATHHERFYSFYWIPYSLLSIASVVANDFEVIIIDDNLKDNEIDFKNLTENCLCVGISAMTGHQISGGLSFAKKIKEHNPEITTVWGGPHATIFPELTIAHPCIDIVVKGQGEFAFKGIVDALKTGKSLRAIDNILYKEKQDIINNGQLPLRNKNILPEFPWQLIDVKKYLRNDPKIGTQILNYVSSQGCPFECTFCSEVALYNRRWKSYGVQRIMQDIDYLVHSGEANAIKFYDANFFVNIPLVMQFAEALGNTDYNITWAASGHPKTLNGLTEDQWQLLNRSRCSRLLIGAESGSQNALDIIKKEITPAMTVSLAEKCSRYDVVGSFTFVVGFPNCGDKDEIEKTLELASHIRAIDPRHDVKLHFYAPYPGTPLFEEAIAAGFKAPASLEQWAYFDYYTIETPWVNPQWEPIIHKFNSENSPYVHL
ncbi:MAG: Anaerobic magnesium-protoporphyrin IX monomethyl ester cyclase [Bacteroidia bacterium]|nr:Anaerobic magnesium-protoporphyrin IX monomethyl ester cyclase [Bacteroidia bacterium]